MEDNVENIKELNINGVVYAKYLIENGIIFINVTKDIIEGNKKESEEFLILLISKLEDEPFSSAGYLNL